MALPRTQHTFDRDALTRVLNRIAATPARPTPAPIQTIETAVPFVPKQYDHRPKWLDCKCGICGAEADMSDRHIPWGWKAVASPVPGYGTVHLCCDECMDEWETLTH